MEQQLKRIKILINEFKKENDLFKLADAQILINDILKENDFPFEEYKLWKK